MEPLQRIEHGISKVFTEIAIGAFDGTGIHARRGETPFLLAVADVMQQRIDAGVGHILIAGQVAARAEFRSRIASFGRAVGQIMLQRVPACGRHILVLVQIPVA